MDVLTALQNSGFKTIDFVILVIYLIVLVSLGLFLSRNKDGKEKSANDYFLAGNTLTWWAVGASLIAANISAEQFIGMSGTGFADGIAIAAYEVPYWACRVSILTLSDVITHANWRASTVFATILPNRSKTNSGLLTKEWRFSPVKPMWTTRPQGHNCSKTR